MEPAEIIGALIDKKILAVLRLFLHEKEQEFTLSEVSKNTKVPVATVFRIINKLHALDIIHINKIKRMKLYRTQQNRTVKFLESFLMESRHILRLFINKIRDLPGLQMIVLHGKEEKDRANILLIGNELDSSFIKEIVAEIYEHNKFVLSCLELTEEQFSQMAKMGLYAGEKRILFRST